MESIDVVMLTWDRCISGFMGHSVPL